MKHFDVHVCMVSDQAIPNFLPVLDKDFRPKKVVLLVTEKMQAKADALESVIKKRCGIHAVRQVRLSGEYEMKAIEQEILQVLTEEEKESVALNLTGGTKLMAIQAFELFRDMGFESFYFTATSNEVIVLGDGEARFTLQPEKVKIEDYLVLYGYPAANGIISREYQFHRPELWDGLVQARDSMGEAIGHLNYAIAQSNKRDLEVDLGGNHRSRHMDDLIGLLRDAELLKQCDRKLVFKGMEEKKYAGGGWFEDYVLSVVRKLPDVQDCAINIQIENNDSHTHQNNELDVVVLVRNRLFVLECKTVNFVKQPEKADLALYKLETLKKLGGLNTQAALVSFRDMEPRSRDRAKGAGIKIIERKDLGGLKTLLENWINGKC